MGKIRKCLLLASLLMLMTTSFGWAQTPLRSGDSGEGVLVGRIAHIEGQLLRYVPEEKDWVATVKDAPFGLEDSLYSEAKARAELIMPNGARTRIGGNTQIQLITLRMDVTEIDVASGVARLYNRSTSGVIKTTSPFGYVVAPAGTIFDLYVGDQSLEIICLKGKVDFILNRDQSRYEVIAGSASVVSDGQQVTSGQGNVDADWDDWNAERDRFWLQRTEVKGDSMQYLPPALYDESYSLDENGRWERVYYEGGYRTFWRPITVSAGWAPFTVGRWTVYYGDNCWVPYEPFGYVTHHYGNWVFVDSSNCWYWAPPVVSVGVNVGPFLAIPFGWYPGRVGWIHSRSHIGWIPLAPFEPYYCHRSWGPRTMIFNNSNINSININRYQYINRAVVINQNNFYNVNNYQNVRIANINRNTIINNYRAAPVINNTVIHNYEHIRQRHDFTNIRVEQKPHDIVLDRIRHNEQFAQQTRDRNANVIQRDVAAIQHAKPVPDIKIEAPRVTDRLVRGSEAGRPQTELQLQQRELKGRSKPPSEMVTGQGQPFEGQPGRLRPEVQPGEPDRDRMLTDEGAKARPLKPGTEMQTPGAGPSSPLGQDGKGVRPPGVGGEVQPAEPGQVKPGTTDTRRVRPPAPQQDVRPPQGGMPGQPVDQGQRVRPSRPEGGLQPGAAGQTRPSVNDTPRVPPTAPQPVVPPPQVRPPAQPGDQGQRVRPSRPEGGLQPGAAGQTRPSVNNTPRVSPTAPQPVVPSPQVRPPAQPGEQGQRVRPSRPDGGMQPGAAGQTRPSVNNTQRVPPTAPQPVVPPPQVRPPAQPGEQGQHVKPQKPARGVQTGEPGQSGPPNN